MKAADREHAWYRTFSTAVADHRIVYMNHGFVADPSAANPAVGSVCWQDACRALVRHILTPVSLTGARVLDIGCGRGGAVSDILELDASWVCGLDHSAESLAFCRSVHAGQSLAFVIGDAQELPIASNIADVVLNIESAHCYPDRSRFLAEVHRVLAPGGYLCMADGSTQVRAREITEQLVDAGFLVDKVEDISTNVRAAIEQSRESMRWLFDDIVRCGTGDRRMLDDLYHSITEVIYRRYLDGTYVYTSWMARKPGDRG